MRRQSLSLIIAHDLCAYNTASEKNHHSFLIANDAVKFTLLQNYFFHVENFKEAKVGRRAIHTLYFYCLLRQ